MFRFFVQSYLKYIKNRTKPGERKTTIITEKSLDFLGLEMCNCIGNMNSLAEGRKYYSARAHSVEIYSGMHEIKKRFLQKGFFTARYFALSLGNAVYKCGECEKDAEVHG